MDKGSLTSKNDFIDVQSKVSTHRGPVDWEAAGLESLTKQRGSVEWHWVSSPCWKELVGTAVHTEDRTQNIKGREDCDEKLVSELRAMPQKLRITSLGLAELIKSLDFWGQLTCQEPESLGGIWDSVFLAKTPGDLGVPEALKCPELSPYYFPVLVSTT